MPKTEWTYPPADRVTPIDGDNHRHPPRWDEPDPAMTSLVDVSQADRDAAASGYFAWISGNPVLPKKMRSGNVDGHSMVQAFARHRLTAEQANAAEIAELTALLRESQYHLRLDAAAKAYHEKVETILNKSAQASENPHHD